MSSPGNAFVRANYLACVIFAQLLVALPLGFVLSAIFDRQATDWGSAATTILFSVCFFVLPGIRALRRVFVNGTVISRELVSERPVVSFVVTLFGGFGHLLFLFTMAGAIGIALAPEWPEEGKKILGPLMVGLAFYFIARWCGELALVGNGESDTARAARSAGL